MVYLTGFSTKATAQTAAIPTSTQVANNAGGFSWAVDDWGRLDRFLVLGSESGTYYVAQSKLTEQNALAALRCIAADGQRVVARIVEISESGRAPKNDPAIFMLALAAAKGDTSTRDAAFAALPAVCRIGTHLLHFAQYVEGFRGWGRGLRRHMSAWYTEKTPSALAYQLVKYQQRDGWAHRDILRLAHPKAKDEVTNALLHWVAKGWPDVGDEPHPEQALRLVWAAEKAKRATSARDVVNLVREYRLPREAVPTEYLKDAEVWTALLEDMPLTALIRNLATLTRVGLLAPMSEYARSVAARIADGEVLRKARVHPIRLLAALKTYAQGRGERGNQTWEPTREIVDALDAAFYASFGNVQATGKRLLLGLDVSGSMAGTMVNGTPGLEARVACGALALITAAVEAQYGLVAFDTNAYALTISSRQRLDDVVKTLSATGGGGTDCSIPLEVARQNRVPVDCFVILTDSETWAGRLHPQQALDAYRQTMGIPAKMVTVAMASNHATLSDPDDAGMLDVVGFDTATPQLISEFARG